MSTVVKPKVSIIEHTPNIDKVIANAGRVCYSDQSIGDLLLSHTSEDNKKMVNKLIELGHLSVTEHCTITFAIENVSRSLTHQLVRHRMASYSQRSQRYVKVDNLEYLIPKDIEDNPVATKLFVESMNSAEKQYNQLMHSLIKGYMLNNYEDITRDIFLNNEEDYFGICSEYEEETLENLEDEIYHIYNMHDVDFDVFLDYLKKMHREIYLTLEKKASENARAVLPNATATSIVVTMNIRSLLHFFELRCCRRSQDEIRKIADMMLKLCLEIAPNVFSMAGASCMTKNTCPEGKMTCGKPRLRSEYI